MDGVGYTQKLLVDIPINPGFNRSMHGFENQMCIRDRPYEDLRSDENGRCANVYDISITSAIPLILNHIHTVSYTHLILG